MKLTFENMTIDLNIFNICKQSTIDDEDEEVMRRYIKYKIILEGQKLKPIDYMYKGHKTLEIIIKSPIKQHKQQLRSASSSNIPPNNSNQLGSKDYSNTVINTTQINYKLTCSSKYEITTLENAMFHPTKKQHNK